MSDDDFHRRPETGYRRLRSLGDGGDPRVDEDAADAADDGKAVRIAQVDSERSDAGKGERVRTGQGFGGGHGSRVTAQITNALAAGGVLDIRGKIPADIPYTTSCWLRTLRDCPWARGIGNDTFFSNAHSCLEALWADENVTWMYLVYGKNPNFLLGFICAEATDQGPVIHWVHVRPEFRRMGFARRLIEAFLQGLDSSRVWYTADTTAGRSAVRTAGLHAQQQGAKGWDYNPFFFWRYLGGPRGKK